MTPPTVEDLDQSIRATVTELRDTFFLAIQEDFSSLNDFLTTWLSFSETVTMVSAKLKSETLSTIHVIASSINEIVASFLEVELKADEIGRDFQTDLSAFISREMDKLSLDDRWAETPQSPYLKGAACWLLDNLHNPYPSHRTRLHLATEMGSNIKDIDNWFSDARRRIGWNSLRRSHFANKKKDIIEAATIFFKSRGSPTLQTSHYDVLFVTMETNAKSIYGGRRPSDCRSRSSNTAYLKQKRQDSPCDPPALSSGTTFVSSYPSPPRSPERSPSPLPPRHLKRRFTDSDDELIQSRKKSKTEKDGSVELPNFVSCLPSPATSLSDLTDTSSSAAESVVAPQSQKGERRVSCSGTRCSSSARQPQPEAAPEPHFSDNNIKATNLTINDCLSWDVDIPESGFGDSDYPGLQTCHVLDHSPSMGSSEDQLFSNYLYGSDSEFLNLCRNLSPEFPEFWDFGQTDLPLSTWDFVTFQSPSMSEQQTQTCNVNYDWLPNVHCMLMSQSIDNVSIDFTPRIC